MITSTGSLNTTALAPKTVVSPAGNINPDAGILLSKDTTSGVANVATVTSTGTIDFGLDAVIPADHFHGDNFGFTEVAYLLPDGYTSGDPISSTLVFLNQSILSLGIDEANAPFTSTLSTGDRLTIQVDDKVDKSLLDTVRSQLNAANLRARILKKKNQKLARQPRRAKRK